MLAAISKSVAVPVIASSGAGKLDDFLEVLQKTSVDAVLAASLFHNKQISIMDLKNYLHEREIKIRTQPSFPPA